MYEIVVTKNRFLVNVHTASTLDGAIDLTNALAEEQWLDHEPDNEDDWIEHATKASAHAACDVNGEEWDAYIIEHGTRFNNLLKEL